MFGQRLQSWLALTASCLLLVMLVCPYLPTPTGVLHGPSVKILIQAMCLVLAVALLVAASGLEPAVIFIERFRALPAADLTDLTCKRLC